jgi:hypothetical protein
MTQPDNNPKTRVGGANKVPLHLVPATAVAHMAMAYADGGLKYQPFNWRVEPISASVYYGAMRRHMDVWWEGEDYDTFVDDQGVEHQGAHHLGAVMACCAMILDSMERPGGLNDNRPPRSNFHALLEQLAARLPALKNRPTVMFDLHEIPRQPLPVVQVVEEPALLRAEDVTQDPCLVRIRWRDAPDRQEWFWLLSEETQNGMRRFLLTCAPDPDTPDTGPRGGPTFWATVDEIEWMKRSRAAESAELDRRIRSA